MTKENKIYKSLLLEVYRKTIQALMLSIGFGVFALSANAEMLDLEKDELKLGFIKLTDCAPLVIAKEKGFFEDEGLHKPIYKRNPRFD